MDETKMPRFRFFCFVQIHYAWIAESKGFYWRQLLCFVYGQCPKSEKPTTRKFPFPFPFKLWCKQLVLHWKSATLSKEIFSWISEACLVGKNTENMKREVCFINLSLEEWMAFNRFIKVCFDQRKLIYMYRSNTNKKYDVYYLSRL